MSVTRVNYRERQRLTAADLLAEQDYRVAAAGRHFVGPHDWGVVVGLHVTWTSSAEIVVQPGLAIDGFGREILVPEALSIDATLIDKSGCSSIAIYYCDRPEQVPPGRRCEDEPPPRTAQRFAIRVVPTPDVALPNGTGFGKARAGGALSGWPPWPVLLARVGKGCPAADGTLVDTRSVRYVHHHASRIEAPSGRVLMQLGLRNREDLYHFLLSTRGSSAAALDSRVGIDRDGQVHVWRQLVLTGPQSVSMVALAQNLTVVMKSPTPAGLGVVRTFSGSIDWRGLQLAGTFRDVNAASLSAWSRDVTIIPKQTRKMLEFADSGVTLTVAGAGLRPLLHPVQPRSTRAQVAAQSATPINVTAETKVGGRLDLLKSQFAAVQADPVRCGDIARVRPQAEPVGPVVILRPGVGLEPGPTSREIQAATVSPPDALVPATELRISGGAEDESDGSSRVSFGEIAASKWKPLMQMDAGRGVQILGDLTVDKAIYLPAIGRADPLLPELMALALMAGLFENGAVVSNLVVTIKNITPATLQRGQKFTYDLEFATAESNIQVKRCVELIAGVTPGRGDLVFRSLTEVTTTKVKNMTTTPIEHKGFRHRADKVQLRVALLIKRGSQNGVVLATSGPTAIDVTD
jgi:hypothetical protein